MTDASQTEGASGDPHAECSQQLAEMEGKWKRALADYQNREKEFTREREEFARWVTADLIRDFLPIIDAVGAAGGKTSGVDGKTPDVEEPASGVEDLAAQEGFRAIHQLCQDFLKRHGVEPVGKVGDHVDYLLHEVVGTKNVPGTISNNAPGTILEVVQVGYTMHGKLLRPAKVIVAE